MKKVIAAILILSVLFCFIAPSARAEEKPQISQTLRLPDLIQQAFEKNPEIATARAEWLAAKKRILASWALPDPMAGLDVMGEMVQTRVGPQDSRFMVSQKIPFPWKLWEKRKVAKASANVARETYEAVKRDVIWKVERAFYSLYEIDASIDVIEEIHALLKKFEGVAQARYSNVSGTQRDVAKAQAEVSLTLEQLFRLRQRRASFEAVLNALLNQSQMTELGKVAQPQKPDAHPTFTELLTLAQANRQEIKAMEARVKKSASAHTLAKLDYIPDVDVGFSYTFVGSGSTMSSEDGKNSWMIPLRINVPLWQNRIIPEIQAARKDVEAAEAKLEGTRNEAFYQVKDAYVRYETASNITLLYETAMIPQAKLALTSDQAGYEGGRTDFLNLLDSERVYLNAKLTYVKVYAETLRSYSDLERATGLDLKEK